MNLTEFAEDAAGRWPEKTAIVEDGVATTYRELRAQIAAYAAALARAGCRPGTRVGLRFPNSSDYIVLTFALWEAGAVVVPAPLECAAEEVSEICAAMELGAMLTDVAQEGSEALGPGVWLTRWADAPVPDNHELNMAFIRFTSGTTAARKGVVLTHEAIRDRVGAANKALQITAADTVMWRLPMSHHFLVTIVLYVRAGATIVLTKHVLAGPFLDAIREARGTILYAAPFHFALLARDRSTARLDSVRLAISTTCALPEDVAKDFRARFGLPLRQGLGIIEAGLVCLNTDDSPQRWNSVGRPVEDFRVRILAPDENGFGDVAVSGPGMLDAYAAPWASREETLRDGWFHTGDIGRVDEDGFLFLAGRKTAVINLAGRKIFPEEIEAVLNRHPAVRESRAYGRVHPHLGETVEADVVLTGPESEVAAVRDYCRTRLAPFKIPSRWNVVEALPRTAVTGKILRPAPVGLA